MHDIVLLAAAACYTGAVVLLCRCVPENDRPRRRLAVTLTGLGLLAHLVAQAMHWLAGPPPDVDVVSLLSLSALIVVALLVSERPTRNPMFEAALVALPIAGAVLVAELLLDERPSVLAGTDARTSVHIVSSVLSFGLLGFAGVYAVLISIVDHLLRRHHLNKAIRSLPALVVLESLLFRIIGLGFVLLTVSLGTGWLYVEDLFAQHLAHKTILSMVAWVVFGVLIWGRLLRGWRGRTAVRMTLAGIGLLILAYFGAKAVLALLDRSWRA